MLDSCALNGQHLVEPPHVPFFTCKFCAEKRLDQLGRDRDSDHARTEHKNIHIVMFHALVRRVRVMANGGSDSVNLVRRDGCAHTAAADKNSTVSTALEDRFANRFRKIGIIDSRCAVCAHVDDFVAQSLQ